jgi:hypothetical protein
MIRPGDGDDHVTAVLLATMMLVWSLVDSSSWLTYVRLTVCPHQGGEHVHGRRCNARSSKLTELNWKFSRDDNSSVHERVAAITMVRFSHPPIECAMVA